MADGAQAWRRWLGARRQVQPVTDRNRRFIARFLKAGWDPAEVADLFDVDLFALQMAFDLA